MWKMEERRQQQEHQRQQKYVVSVRCRGKRLLMNTMHIHSAFCIYRDLLKPFWKRISGKSDSTVSRPGSGKPLQLFCVYSSSAGEEVDNLGANVGICFQMKSGHWDFRHTTQCRVSGKYAETVCNDTSGSGRNPVRYRFLLQRLVLQTRWWCRFMKNERNRCH